MRSGFSDNNLIDIRVDDQIGVVRDDDNFSPAPQAFVPFAQLLVFEKNSSLNRGGKHVFKKSATKEFQIVRRQCD